MIHQLHGTAGDSIIEKNRLQERILRNVLC